MLGTILSVTHNTNSNLPHLKLNIFPILWGYYILDAWLVFFLIVLSSLHLFMPKLGQETQTWDFEPAWSRKTSCQKWSFPHIASSCHWGFSYGGGEKKWCLWICIISIKGTSSCSTFFSTILWKVIIVVENRGKKCFADLLFVFRWINPRPTISSLAGRMLY